jgi:predicted RNA-binding protein with PUA-like domain
MRPSKACWLVKSEPESFSIHDLAKSPNQTTAWSGVRNYQARNFMRAMKRGDCVLFYHSSADPPAVAGTAMVMREAYPDTTALDPKDDHYDPKATRDNPIWEMVDIRLFQVFAEPVPIGKLRTVKRLAQMDLLRPGSRLSVQPVRPRELEIIMQLARDAAKRLKSKSASRTFNPEASPTARKRIIKRKPKSKKTPARSK